MTITVTESVALNRNIGVHPSRRIGSADHAQYLFLSNGHAIAFYLFDNWRDTRRGHNHYFQSHSDALDHIQKLTDLNDGLDKPQWFIAHHAPKYHPWWEGRTFRKPLNWIDGFQDWDYERYIEYCRGEID